MIPLRLPPCPYSRELSSTPLTEGGCLFFLSPHWHNDIVESSTPTPRPSELSSAPLRCSLLLLGQRTFPTPQSSHCLPSSTDPPTRTHTHTLFRFLSRSGSTQHRAEIQALTALTYPSPSLTPLTSNAVLIPALRLTIPNWMQRSNLQFWPDASSNFPGVSLVLVGTGNSRSVQAPFSTTHGLNNRWRSYLLHRAGLSRYFMRAWIGTRCLSSGYAPVSTADKRSPAETHIYHHVTAAHTLIHTRTSTILVVRSARIC